MAWFWGVQYGEELWLSVLGFVGSILYMAVLPAVLYRQLHRCYAVNSLYAGPGHHRFGFLFLRFEPGQWGYEFRIFGRKAGLLRSDYRLAWKPTSVCFPVAILHPILESQRDNQQASVRGGGAPSGALNQHGGATAQA